jgi:hypothetical protein
MKLLMLGGQIKNASTVHIIIINVRTLTAKEKNAKILQMFQIFLLMDFIVNFIVKPRIEKL